MKNKPICSCIICKSVITSCNLINHYNSKQCLSGGKYIPKPKSSNCKYCNIDFTNFSNSEIANHSRWCTQNPSSALDRSNLQSIRENITTKSIKKRAESISIAHKNGKYRDMPAKVLEAKIKNGTLNHTEASKHKCSVSALNSKHQRKCKKSHIFICKNGREFTFDSSWEDAFAIRMDELNIAWDRPPPIQYTLPTETKIRNYFPDFYLPKYNIFVDPKNSYCIKQQKSKLYVVSKIINLLIIDNKYLCETISEEYIAWVAGLELA